MINGECQIGTNKIADFSRGGILSRISRYISEALDKMWQKYSIHRLITGKKQMSSRTR